MHGAPREMSTESNKKPNGAGENLSSACACRASRLWFVDTRRIASLFRLNALSLPDSVGSNSALPSPMCQSCHYLRRGATEWLVLTVALPVP